MQIPEVWRDGQPDPEHRPGDWLDIGLELHSGDLPGRALYVGARSL